MKKALIRYGLCLIPFIIFAGHGAVCAYRLANNLPAGDNPYREPEWLEYLSGTAVIIGAAISGVALVTVAINDIWLFIEEKIKARNIRNLTKQ